MQEKSTDNLSDELLCGDSLPGIFKCWPKKGFEDARGTLFLRSPAWLKPDDLRISAENVLVTAYA